MQKQYLRSSYSVFKRQVQERKKQLLSDISNKKSQYKSSIMPTDEKQFKTVNKQKLKLELKSHEKQNKIQNKHNVNTLKLKYHYDTTSTQQILNQQPKYIQNSVKKYYRQSGTNLQQITKTKNIQTIATVQSYCQNDYQKKLKNQLTEQKYTMNLKLGGKYQTFGKNKKQQKKVNIISPIQLKYQYDLQPQKDIKQNCHNQVEYKANLNNQVARILNKYKYNDNKFQEQKPKIVPYQYNKSRLQIYNQNKNYKKNSQQTYKIDKQIQNKQFKQQQIFKGQLNNSQTKRQFNTLQVKGQFKTLQAKGQFNTFQAKVNTINNYIQQSLWNISDQIQQIKINKINKISKHKQKLYQSLSINSIQQSPLHMLQIPYPQQIDLQQNNNLNSHVVLQRGTQNQGVVFTQQYTKFINRLSAQISLDMEFTALVWTFTKNKSINTIKNLIFSQISKYKNSQISIRQQFFQIQTSQIDPLQNIFTVRQQQQKQQQLKEKATNLYAKYRQIQLHYASKLEKKYVQQTILFLFQQLSQFNFTSRALSDTQNITIGHLLSYLNMRTNKSFRIRAFVKLSKRLDIKMNEFLTVNSFGSLMK